MVKKCLMFNNFLTKTVCNFKKIVLFGRALPWRYQLHQRLASEDAPAVGRYKGKRQRADKDISDKTADQRRQPHPVGRIVEGQGEDEGD